MTAVVRGPPCTSKCPVLLGDGVGLYGGGMPRFALRRVELEPGDQVAGLRFRV